MDLLEGISDGEWDKFYGRGIVLDPPIQWEKLANGFSVSLVRGYNFSLLKFQ